VELRGFEPMAITGAGRSRATESDGGQARRAKGLQLTPRYGSVCQVVWKGRCREVSPYPDHTSIPDELIGFAAQMGAPMAAQSIEIMALEIGRARPSMS
jgi:hypothetical protein